MKVLVASFLLIMTFESNAQRRPERVYPVLCDGDEMISNQGLVIHRFTFSSDCRDALAESKINRGRFCDRENLFRPNGIQVHSFTFSSDCKEALEDLRRPSRGLFCDSGDLISFYRGPVASMTFESDCKRAIQEVVNFRGYFCNDGVMMNYLGRRLRDYGTNFRCRDALSTISQGIFNL